MLPEISVVICTHNRAERLRDAVAAVQNQDLSREKFEIVVVKNGPDEESYSDVGQADNFINVVKITEPRLGLSHARNTGWQQAKGRYVSFLDDDAIPLVNWLSNLWNCLERNPTIGVLGGAVHPHWSQPVPVWLEKELYPALSICYYDGPADGFPLDFPRQYPVGANITYSRQMLASLGGFDPGFGRHGTKLLSGEETELNFRSKAAGWQIWFCPSAIVSHYIFPSRMRPDFFRQRYHWSGRTWALLDHSLYGSSYLVRRSLHRLALAISLDFARYFYFGWIKRRNPLLTEIYYRELMGYLIQAINLLRERKPEVL